MGDVQRNEKSLGVFYFAIFCQSIAELGDRYSNTHKDG